VPTKASESAMNRRRFMGGNEEFQQSGRKAACAF